MTESLERMIKRWTYLGFKKMHFQDIFKRKMRGSGKETRMGRWSDSLKTNSEPSRAK